MSKKELKGEIIQYLKQKGKIRAALLHKLENKFCNKKSGSNITCNDLYSIIFEMMEERIIDIIIPEIFQVDWREEDLKNLNYLKNGTYFVRKYVQVKNVLLKGRKDSKYFFHSRELIFNPIEKNKEIIDYIKSVIFKMPILKYKMFIYYPKGSLPLRIYDSLQVDYDFPLDHFKSPLIEPISEKIEISKNQQIEHLDVLKSYRKNFMCFYITLIEVIQKKIYDLQVNKDKIKDYEYKFKEYIRKFGYYSAIYTNSDWIDILKPNPYRWETFFKLHDLPIEILSFRFRSIKFHYKTFEIFGQIKFCIYIDKSFHKLLKSLKRIGYIEFKPLNYENKVAIGLDLDVFLPCPSIEHLYFLIKYVLYFYLFLLFNHTFTYILDLKKGYKFTEKEKNLYKIFLPVINSLFNIDFNDLNKKVQFKYYSRDSDELELIYNHFMLKNVKKIETTLFKYFLLRFPKNLK